MCDVTDAPCYMCIFISPINAVMLNYKLNVHGFNLTNCFCRGSPIIYVDLTYCIN